MIIKKNCIQKNSQNNLDHATLFATIDLRFVLWCTWCQSQFSFIFPYFITGLCIGLIFSLKIYCSIQHPWKLHQKWIDWCLTQHCIANLHVRVQHMTSCFNPHQPVSWLGIFLISERKFRGPEIIAPTAKTLHFIESSFALIVCQLWISPCQFYVERDAIFLQTNSGTQLVNLVNLCAHVDRYTHTGLCWWQVLWKHLIWTFTLY